MWTLENKDTCIIEIPNRTLLSGHFVNNNLDSFRWFKESITYCSTVHMYKTWYVHTLYTTHYVLPHMYQILIRKSELLKISQHRSLKYFNGVIYCKPAKVSLPMEATSTAMHTIAIKLPLLNACSGINY